MASSSRTTADSSSAPILLVLICWLAIVCLADVRYRPPLPQPSTVSEERFSAGRAELIFADLFVDDLPHPAGSPANRQLQAKIRSWFETFGYRVELHQSIVTSGNSRFPANQAVELTNIFAIRRGTTDLPPVMLTAHFDSVPASPGASDDGVGTAVVLEIARMMQQAAPPRRDVIFLLTDGEEFGLLGADRFVNEHPLAKRIAAVVNLEARGSGGPSLMFETSANSGWLIRLFSRVATRPFTSSLFYEIYRRLPNDTDFSIYARYGMQGYNFAFIGNVKHYHTPEDNFSNANRGSMQHHGEQALALLRQLANIDIEAQPAGRAVYFDFFSWFVVYWPAEYSMWFALLATVVYGLSIWRIKQWSTFESPQANKHLRPPLGLIAVVASVAAVGLVVRLVDVGLRYDGVFDNPFPATALPVHLAFWMFGFAAMAICGEVLSHRFRWTAIWAGVWLMWCGLSLASASWLTGGCYLFIVPAAAAALTGAASWLVSPRVFRALALLPGLVVGLLWLPQEHLFYDAVGFSMNQILVARVTVVLISIMPAVCLASPRIRLGLLWISGTIGVAATLVSVLSN